MEFPDKWAVLFGPKKYRYVRPLDYSTEDVQEVGEALRERYGFQDDHILSFGEGLRFQPTRSEFYHEVGGLLKSGRIQPDHLLVFFFSGHGVRDKKDYLLPVEASPNDLPNTSIEVEDIVNKLVGTKCKNVVMFIDACRESIPGQKGVFGIGEFSKGVVERSGVITLFSCDPTDCSYEIPELKHGSFTYCLLEAIKSGKYATVGEIYDYLLKELPLTNERYGKPPQKPYAIMVPEEKRHLRLFVSGPQAQQLRKESEDLRDHLGDLVASRKIAEEYWSYVRVAIVFLNTVKMPGLTDEDKQKYRYIQLWCAEQLDAETFKVFWEAHERRRGPIGGPPKTNTNLEPLQ